MKCQPVKLKGSLLALVLVSVFNASAAQQPADRNVFADAEYYFLFQDYAEALPLYLRLIEAQPNNPNFNYRVGVCYLNIPGQKTKAIPYLERAVKNINLKYREGSFNENSAPLDALFQLANAYRITNRLDEAIETYTQYSDRLDPKDVYGFDFVKQQIEATRRARLFLSQPLNLRWYDINLFEGSSKQVYSPVISANGQFLVVTVQEKFYDAIYISKRDGDSWGPPSNITLDIALEGEIYATSISADGTQLFFFKNDRGVGNIYTSLYLNGKWQKAVKLGGSISSRYWETHASISADGQTLYFTSNRRGGFGGLDIYVSHLQANGDWGPAINLGPTINTPFNEEAPYLTPDGQSLIFASQGHMGMGGFDIFCAKKIDENTWAQPINMGYPISTTDDDMFFFPLSSGNGLVSLAKNQKQGGTVLQYVQIERITERISIPIVGKIHLSDNEEVIPLLFNILLVDKKTKKMVANAMPRGIHGDFALDAAPGTYEVIVTGKGYLPDTVVVSLLATYNLASYPVNFNLVPETVGKGETVTIRSVQYGFDSFKLSREAQFELERIIAFMQKYPSLTIEVTGHTDSKGSVTYNRNLSLKRAESVVQYLKSKGVASNRMAIRAAGSFENVASNINPDGTDNPEGRAYNRRATISLLNSNEKITIRDELQVPEHLKPRVQKTAVLLVPLGAKPNPAAVAMLKQKRGLETNAIAGSGKMVAYTAGSFTHKAEAVELLNFCIENGFPGAALIGTDDLEAIVKPEGFRLPGRAEKSNDMLYTIQLAASQEPISFPSELKLEVIKLKNGTLIYHFGRYNEISDAEKDLERIVSMGYPNAFVVNIKRFADQ